MCKVYVYESDDGFDLILSDREFTEEERYCSHCSEYKTLKKVTSTLDELVSMFSEYGYTPDCAKYHELVEQFNAIIGG